MNTPLTKAEQAVFGVDAYRDEAGNIVEQGFGALAKKTDKMRAIEKEGEAAAKENLAKLEARAKQELERAEEAVKAKEQEGKDLLAKAADIFKGIGKAIEDEF